MDPTSSASNGGRELEELVNAPLLNSSSKANVSPSVVTPFEKCEFAVHVCDANLTYAPARKGHRRVILRDIGLKIYKGSVYALLGPSGCGKTTLLKIINGRLPLDSGEVRLFGRPIRDLPTRKRSALMGFMPQEPAQYSQFTIEETIFLYGKLQNMSNLDIGVRLKYLIQLLELPQKHKRVGQISCGQQRRVSLASALIHSPPLLILDEPTVGVDPLLRQKIWKYLNDLSYSQGSTIIITTHYTEEARTASRVGLMRNGEILVECSPTQLMKKLGQNTLEACFIEICAQKETSLMSTDDASKVNAKAGKLKKAQLSGSKMGVLLKYHLSRKRENLGSRISKRSVSLSDLLLKVKIILWRNFLFSKKNFPLLFFQLLLPLATVNFICISVGTKVFDVAVGLVNDEVPVDFSQIFTNSIDNSTLLIHKYPNLNEGLHAVRRAEVKGIIHIKNGFSKCIHDKVQLGLAADRHIVECSSIVTHFDHTNSVLFALVQQNILRSYKKFFQEILVLADLDDTSSFPIDMSNAIYGYEDEPFTDYLLPGAMVFLSFYMPLLANLFTFIWEKQSGLQDRLRVSGVTFTQLLISQFLTQTIIVLGQVPLLLIAPIFVFGLPLIGSLTLTYTLLVLQGVVGLTFGFLISSITSNQNVAIMIVISTLYTNMSFSGFLWPLEGMPRFLRRISYYFPITMPVEALRSIMCRGWNIYHQTTYLAFVASMSWIIIFVAITFITLKVKKQH